MYDFLKRPTKNKKAPTNNIRVLSLFTGAGGLDLGFHALGYSVIFMNDIDQNSCKTLARNTIRYVDAGTQIECVDIRELGDSRFPENIDFVIGGPPCQSFSAFGRRAGGAAGRLDKRGTLFETYCDILKKLQPKGFLFENVRGILSTNKGDDWQKIRNSFASIGYNLSARILDACDYGVPQHRERLFLVGQRKDSVFLFPRPVFGPDSPSKKPHITLGEALQGIHNNSAESLSLKLGEGKYSHLLDLVPEGQNYLFFTERRGYPNPIFAYRSRFSDFLYKSDPNQPVKTIIASPGKYSGPFHWENRRFSIQEYKRIQGFPDDFDFVGDRNSVIQQIGNSVCPPISYYLAKCVALQIFNCKYDVELLPEQHQLSFDRRKSIKAKATRKLHQKVAIDRTERSILSFSSYDTRIEPTHLEANVLNCHTTEKKGMISLSLRTDGSRPLYCRMKLSLFAEAVDHPDGGSKKHHQTIEVTAYGQEPYSIQTMWNSIDDLIIRSSNYHSLYELYGHFTEPHPQFRITAFDIFSKHPIAQFAKHAANFENCSRYFPRENLLSLFGDSFGTTRFIDLVRILRGFRFDIRCHETNIAIPEDLYMVAYPFTLPHRKQMNFAHARPLERVS